MSLNPVLFYKMISDNIYNAYNNKE